MPRTPTPWAPLVLLGLPFLLTGCSEGTSTGPTPPPVGPALAITCPAAQTGVSVLSQPVAVSWTAPTTSGGTAPVSTSCSPATGSTFAAGTTAVTCNAIDAASQFAKCSFDVVITRPPQISVSRFLAFGDSITWGTDRDAIPAAALLEPPPSTSYPNQLAGTLSARYLDQTVTMANEGWPGEAIETGVSRLPGVLTSTSPQVLLLLHGANNLLGSPTNATADYIASQLRLMIRATKAQRPATIVLLANFPPQFHPTAEELSKYCTDGVNRDRGLGAEIVPYLNQKIAALAGSEGATLVDLYAPLNTAVKTYIGCDGLHPTVAGFTLMAETFYSVIQRTFETSGATLGTRY
jgi:lysophospholipase L1-like esterase